MNTLHNNSDLLTINNVNLQIEDDRIYVVGNSYPIKDKMKMHGARWNPERKLWYFQNTYPDLNHLLKETHAVYICCPFAFNINKEVGKADCAVKCKTYKELQDKLESERKNLEMVRKMNAIHEKQMSNDIDKYIVIYHCRDWGETTAYGMRFDTLEKATADFETYKKDIGKRTKTVFSSHGTLWGISIVHNNIIIDNYWGETEDEESDEESDIEIMDYMNSMKKKGYKFNTLYFNFNKKRVNSDDYDDVLSYDEAWFESYYL